MMAQNNFKICRFCINIYSGDSKGYSNTDSERDSDSDSDSYSDSGWLWFNLHLGCMIP